MRFVLAGALMGARHMMGANPWMSWSPPSGCILMALGLLMAANRSGYVYFVVGPRAVLLLASAVGVFGYWVLRGPH